MANRISLLKSEVVGATPTASAMAIGELAVNYADKKIFGKHPGSGAVVQIAASPVHTHAISDVNGLQSALNAAALYNLSTLPYSGTDGHIALITNGSSTAGPTMAYYYNGSWYRTLDNSQIWTPNEISTVFWYDPSDPSTITSSGSNVTSVTDKSGNNYTLTPEAGQNTALTGTRSLNGFNVLEWTGNNCLENNSFAYATTPLNFAFILLHDNVKGILPQEFIFSGTENTGDPRIFARRDGNDRYQLNAGNTEVSPNDTIIANNPYIIVNQISSTTSLVRVNGEEKVSGNIGTNSFQQLRLGHNESEMSDLDGYFAEIIAFDDNSQQEKVEGYLAWKWGLVANLPAGHPYKTAAP